MASRQRDQLIAVGCAQRRDHFEVVTPHPAELAHDRAAVGNALNDPLLFQLEESEADAGAMGIKLLAKVLLDQPFARMAPAEHDVLLEPPGDHSGDRTLARRMFCKRLVQL